MKLDRLCPAARLHRRSWNEVDTYLQVKTSPLPTAIRRSLHSCQREWWSDIWAIQSADGLVGVHAVRVSPADALRRRRWPLFAGMTSAYVTEQHNVARLNATERSQFVKWPIARARNVGLYRALCTDVAPTLSQGQMKELLDETEDRLPR